MAWFARFRRFLHFHNIVISILKIFIYKFFKSSYFIQSTLAYFANIMIISTALRIRASIAWVAWLSAGCAASIRTAGCPLSRICWASLWWSSLCAAAAGWSQWPAAASWLFRQCCVSTGRPTAGQRRLWWCWCGVCQWHGTAMVECFGSTHTVGVTYTVGRLSLGLEPCAQLLLGDHCAGCATGPVPNQPILHIIRLIIRYNIGGRVATFKHTLFLTNCDTF